MVLDGYEKPRMTCDDESGRKPRMTCDDENSRKPRMAYDDDKSKNPRMAYDDDKNKNPRRTYDDEKTENPRMTYIYCPLLPHDENPHFDPATAEFSTSYNLIWNKNQADSIFKTVRACVEFEVVRVVRDVVRRRMVRQQEEERVSG